MNRCGLASALGAVFLGASLALAQAPTGAALRVRGRLRPGGEGALRFDADRSWALANQDRWSSALSDAIDQEPEVLLDVRGQCLAEVLELTLDVRGETTVMLSSAAPVESSAIAIQSERGATFKVFRGPTGSLSARWFSWLERMGRLIQARLRVTEPTPSGGVAEVLGVYFEVEGNLLLAEDGGLLIEVRDQRYEILGQRFRGLLREEAGKSSFQPRVRIRLLLVEPVLSRGRPAGGGAEVVQLHVRTAQSGVLHRALGPARFPVARIAAGSTLSVSGPSHRFPGFLEVTLPDGRSGIIRGDHVLLSWPRRAQGAGLAGALRPSWERDSVREDD